MTWEKILKQNIDITQINKSIGEASSWWQLAENAERNASLNFTDAKKKRIYEFVAKKATEYAKTGRVYNQEEAERLLRYAMGMDSMGAIK